MMVFETETSSFMLYNKYIVVLRALLVVSNVHINTTEYLLLRVHIKITGLHSYLQDAAQFIPES